MKLSLIAMLMLGVVSCAKTTPPPAAKPVEAPIHNASAEDCSHVYERVLALSLTQNLDPDKTYSQKELQAGVILLDMQYTLSGKKDLFFSYCTSRLNVNQTTCMLSAQSFEDMDVCDKLFATKKVSK